MNKTNGKGHPAARNGKPPSKARLISESSVLVRVTWGIVAEFGREGVYVRNIRSSPDLFAQRAAHIILNAYRRLEAISYFQAEFSLAFMNLITVVGNRGDEIITCPFKIGKHFGSSVHAAAVAVTADVAAHLTSLFGAGNGRLNPEQADTAEDCLVTHADEDLNELLETRMSLCAAHDSTEDWLFEMKDINFELINALLELEATQAMLVADQVHCTANLWDNFTVPGVPAITPPAPTFVERSSPMSLVDAGRKMAPETYTSRKQDAAAREYIKRLMTDPSFPWEKVGEKYVFDLSRFPGWSDPHEM